MPVLCSHHTRWNAYLLTLTLTSTLTLTLPLILTPTLTITLTLTLTRTRWNAYLAYYTLARGLRAPLESFMCRGLLNRVAAWSHTVAAWDTYGCSLRAPLEPAASKVAGATASTMRRIRYLVITHLAIQVVGHASLPRPVCGHLSPSD